MIQDETVWRMIMVNISWAILACNEKAEIDKLLTLLCRHVDTNDEIVVVLDTSTYTRDVEIVIDKHIKNNKNLDIHKFFNPLNMNFANQKNFLNSKCTKDYIFNVDADELIPESLVRGISQILESNPTVDAFWLPRVNTVAGLTQDDISRWGWHVNNRGWINWPDWQLRVYKNTDGINWVNSVHERLIGYEHFSRFPEDPAYAIVHPKTIERQRKQNEFYEKIVR